MKRFNELNESQKVRAIAKSAEAIKELVEYGLVLFTKNPSDKQILQMAEIAADSAYYPEFGDKVFNDIA